MPRRRSSTVNNILNCRRQSIHARLIKTLRKSGYDAEWLAATPSGPFTGNYTPKPPSRHVWKIRVSCLCSVHGLRVPVFVQGFKRLQI